MPLYGVETMRGIYARSVWQPRLYGALFTSFAVIALLLAAAGVYSVIAYSVTQRLHEIGVRMALGAKRGDVFRLVVQGGARLALIGVVLGTLGALAATRVLTTLLYGVSPTDPSVFVAMGAVLLGTALVASYVPARRAASLDPVTALRMTEAPRDARFRSLFPVPGHDSRYPIPRCSDSIATTSATLPIATATPGTRSSPSRACHSASRRTSRCSRR
jgi:hypothetical protein